MLSSIITLAALGSWFGWCLGAWYPLDGHQSKINSQWEKSLLRWTRNDQCPLAVL